MSRVRRRHHPSGTLMGDAANQFTGIGLPCLHHAIFGPAIPQAAIPQQGIPQQAILGVEAQIRLSGFGIGTVAFETRSGEDRSDFEIEVD